MSKLIESSEYLYTRVQSMHAVEGQLREFLLDLQAPQAFGSPVPPEIRLRAHDLLGMMGRVDG
tara:strand:+ start:256 stop:444 length:189 start_codon:yes stop_codon:yes gene_type:complete